MSKSSKSRPKRTQMHPKRTPESFQDQRCDQRNPEKVSRGGQGPRGAPEANQGQKLLNSLSKIYVFKKNMKFLKQNKGFTHKIASRRGVQRPKVCNCHQTHFWKKIEMFLKTVSLTPLSHFRPPQSGLRETIVPEP